MHKNRQKARAGKNSTIIQNQGNGSVQVNPAPKDSFNVDKQVGKPITVNGKPVRTAWIGITAAIALAADLITLYQWQAPPMAEKVLGLTGVLSFGILILWAKLRDDRVLVLFRQPILTHAGRLYWGNYTGKCPEPNCPGHLRLRQYWTKEQPPITVECNFYPQQHWAVLNPRIFD